MASRASGARFRQRKLSTKHALQILQEDELVDSFHDEDDPSRQVARVETGVEKAEETEHHLQAVISASAAASLGGKIAQIYIPTPEVKSSDLKYDDLYPKRFSEPTTYIRFSSTVEDSIGPPYCVTSEDEKFIASLNESKAAKDGRLTFDLFEEVVSFFEATATIRQPFATIDNPPVLSFEEIQSSFDYTISDDGQKWAPEIYPHWHGLRMAKSNQSLMPALKFETGAETDDSDAYVCFRRREVRQARKTRGRDAQVVEKLKKLRRELEDARQLVHSINAREKLNLERIECDRKVFDQRQELKRVKIQHGIKGDKGDDEELLINQRPVVKPKPKAEVVATQQRPTTLKLTASSRSDVRPPEQDLVQIEDLREEAEAMVRRAVESKIQKHREWNRGFTDHTWRPICPPDYTRAGSSHLPTITEVQLPTPPASVEGGDEAADKMDVDQPDKDAKPRDLPTPPSDAGAKSLPTFRRRYGRLGRLHIDAVRPRRVVPSSASGVVYDSDSDLETPDDEGEDDDVVMYPLDYWNGWNLSYRASLMMSARKPDQSQPPESARKISGANAAPGTAQGDVPMSGGAGTAGATDAGGSGGG
ncbi:hypothetical protein K461DRAFT_219932 [Myriangium duriaei CBS 260.36]|uniref:Enhancer of polycomb-like protein n=1 Tax=Myriangium duriaei CBS 260.36 TaxID=1168546 RepID=A0A9P4MM63_9PEZI|nr:hypothetical protein K461DRAFT_219932 [Myriangium duriaei CBS 260.36]